MSVYLVTRPAPSPALGLAYRPTGGVVSWDAVAAPPPPPPPPPASVLPALQLEHIDASGARQTIPVVSGVTTITGIAPMMVQFDASGSRAPTAFAAQGAIPDEEAYAYLMAGYRMGYGDAGGTWTYPIGTSYPKNEDTGPPVFSHTYRTPGTYQAPLRVRDALGNESTITCNVVVQAPPAATHIPESAGSWPTFVSGSRYTLQAGGDYRSFGTLETGGRHNIIFEKVGDGSDPRIGTFSPDGRSKFSAVALFEFRASNIRFINVDILRFQESQRGFDYCGVFGGKVRNYDYGGQVFLWHEGTNVTRSNVRYCRGLFFEDTEVSNENQSNGFVVFGDMRGFHCRNTQFVHRVNGPTTWLMIRVYGTHHTFRNCFWYSEVDGGGANGLPHAQLGMAGITESVWREDNLVGPVDETDNGNRYGYICDKQVSQNNHFYGPGSFLTNGTFTSGGGTPSGALRVRPRLCGCEDSVYEPFGAIAQSTIQTASLAGRYMFWRNVRKGRGAGDYIGATTFPPNQGAGDNVTYNGTPLIETVNTRPVPTPF